MSIFRQPYEHHDHRGGLDSGLTFYLLEKYGKGHLLEQFKGGETLAKIWCKLEPTNSLGYKGISLTEHADARHLILPDASFETVISHPPYWTAIKYSENPNDLSTCGSYDIFMKEFSKTLDEGVRVLACGGYFIVVVGDIRKNKVYYPLHSDIIQYMKKYDGVKLVDIIIWELSSSSTPFISTQWMLMGNFCLIFKKEMNELPW